MEERSVGNGLRDLEKLLVDLLQGIDTLLQLDVVGWELSLGPAD